MNRIIVFAAAVLLLASCKRDLQCYCRLNGLVILYEFHKTSYSDAMSRCDSYVAGDTCDIPLRK